MIVTSIPVMVMIISRFFVHSTISKKFESFPTNVLDEFFLCHLMIDSLSSCTTRQISYRHIVDSFFLIHINLPFVSQKIENFLIFVYKKSRIILYQLTYVTTIAGYEESAFTLNKCKSRISPT